MRASLFCNAYRINVFGLCVLFEFCVFLHSWGVLLSCVSLLGVHGGGAPVGVGVVVSVLGRSVDALVPGADEGRGRPR